MAMEGSTNTEVKSALTPYDVMTSPGSNFTSCTSKSVTLLSTEIWGNTICPTYGTRYYKTLLHCGSSYHTISTPSNWLPPPFTLYHTPYEGKLNSSLVSIAPSPLLSFVLGGASLPSCSTSRTPFNMKIIDNTLQHSVTGKGKSP